MTGSPTVPAAADSVPIVLKGRITAYTAELRSAVAADHPPRTENSTPRTR